MHIFKTILGISTALLFAFGTQNIASAQTPLILQESEKLNSTNDSNDRYGFTSAIHVDMAIVGAYDVDINGIHSGASYFYRFDGNSWIEEPIVLPSQSSTYAYFG